MGAHLSSGHLHDLVLLLKCLALRGTESWDRLMSMAAHAEQRRDDAEVKERLDRLLFNNFHQL